MTSKSDLLISTILKSLYKIYNTKIYLHFVMLLSGLKALIKKLHQSTCWTCLLVYCLLLTAHEVVAQLSAQFLFTRFLDLSMETKITKNQKISALGFCLKENMLNIVLASEKWELEISVYQYDTNNSAFIYMEMFFAKVILK